MITKIIITVEGEHLDWNKSAPPGGTTPKALKIVVNIETDEASEKVSQAEAARVLTAALDMVLNYHPPKKQRKTQRKS